MKSDVKTQVAELLDIDNQNILLNNMAGKTIIHNYYKTVISEPGIMIQSGKCLLPKYEDLVPL